MNKFHEIKDEKFVFVSPVMVINDNGISYKMQEGVCNLKIGTYEDKHVVVLTEISENKGDKITNAFKEIANQVYYKFFKKIDPNNIIWIEHYNVGLPQDEYNKPYLKWIDTCYSKINWNEYIFNDMDSILTRIKK